MKPAPFDYHVPETVPEVVELLEEEGEETKVLAGGQSLIPLLNLRLARFASLVDLRRVGELRSLEFDGATVAVGAMVRQSGVGSDPSVAAGVPLLARATPHIGHFQIRSRGTVGGSLAHADPAAEYPAVAVALDAEFEVAGAAGTRTIPARDFFLGTWWTALDESDVLVRARFPVWDGDSGFAVEEVARRHGDFAVAGAACGIEVTDDVISRAVLALFGVDSTPVRATDVELGLIGSAVDDVDLDAAGHVAVEGLSPPDDLHASSALRGRIGSAVAARSIARALEEATAA